MSKDYSFSVMPSVSISRSRFARKSQHKTSINLGDLVPIYIDEVLPGDTRSMDVASLVRMSTPIAPIMDNIYMDLFAFFVPNRLVWDHWKDFMGENRESAGIRSTSYSIPYLGVLTPNNNHPIEGGSYGDYAGLPIGVNKLMAQNKISALPFRGIALIYNEWFRNQNVIAPLAIDTSDSNQVIIGDVSTNAENTFVTKKASVLKVAKLADYFTKALPYAQKGGAVSIPLGTTAPIIAQVDPDDFGDGAYALGFAADEIPTSGKYNLSTMGYGMYVQNDGNPVTSAYLEVQNDAHIVADLSQATAASINQLRYAFQLQKLLEKDALYGTRYWEILAAHFGVTAPDASLQRPEYLGGKRININIDQVLSTAGYDDTSSTDLGKPGANSVTGDKSSLFTKSFCEHGYIFIFACARHDQTYMQGINRMWTRQNRFDFYWPVFANLGAQEIKYKEIYAQGTADDDGVFGYQESWSEYRYRPSMATSILRPIAGNLTFWTLTNNFGSKPTLGQTFIEQDRNNLARALSTSITGPDFICDFYFQDIAVRPMPMYSIPGLIDHH